MKIDISEIRKLHRYEDISTLIKQHLRKNSKISVIKLIELMEIISEKSNDINVCFFDEFVSDNNLFEIKDHKNVGGGKTAKKSLYFNYLLFKIYCKSNKHIKLLDELIEDTDNKHENTLILSMLMINYNIEDTVIYIKNKKKTTIYEILNSVISRYQKISHNGDNINDFENYFIDSLKSDVFKKIPISGLSKLISRMNYNSEGCDIINERHDITPSIYIIHNSMNDINNLEVYVKLISEQKNSLKTHTDIIKGMRYSKNMKEYIELLKKYDMMYTSTSEVLFSERVYFLSNFFHKNNNGDFNIITELIKHGLSWEYVSDKTPLSLPNRDEFINNINKLCRTFKLEKLINSNN